MNKDQSFKHQFDIWKGNSANLVEGTPFFILTHRYQGPNLNADGNLILDSWDTEPHDFRSTADDDESIGSISIDDAIRLYNNENESK